MIKTIIQTERISICADSNDGITVDAIDNLKFISAIEEAKSHGYKEVNSDDFRIWIGEKITNASAIL